MTRKSRRKVLKDLAITLPAAWSTPMVESIILPAHAQTSPSCSVVITDTSIFLPESDSGDIRICFNTEWCMNGTIDSSGAITITDGIAPGCSGPAAALTGGQIVGWPDPTGVVNGTLIIDNWVCDSGTITCSRFTGSFGVLDFFSSTTLSGETQWEGTADCCDRVWQTT